MSAKAENLSHLTEIRDAQSALEKVLYQYRIHPEYYDKRLDSQKAIEAYYKNYFSSKTEETKYPRTIGNTTINLVDLLSWNRIGQEQFKRKEILFIKEDISKIQNAKTDYSRLIKYYKRRLVDYGVMKEIRDFKTKDGKFKKEKISSRMEEIVSA